MFGSPKGGDMRGSRIPDLDLMTMVGRLSGNRIPNGSAQHMSDMNRLLAWALSDSTPTRYTCSSFGSP